MGRFDIIKENAFSSNEKPEKRKRGGRGKKKENVSKVEYSPMVKPTKDNVVIEEKKEIKKDEIKKEEVKKEEVKEEELVLKPIKSDWLNKINKVKLNKLFNNFKLDYKKVNKILFLKELYLLLV